MAIQEVNAEESFFSVGGFKGMWIFQINLKSVSGLHVPHFNVSLSCNVGLTLVLARARPAMLLVLTWSQPPRLVVLSLSR